MLNVSNEYAQAILSDSRDMPYRVTINSETLDKTKVTSMQLNESVSGGNGLALGTANAAELTLTLREPELTNYNGMLVEPESGLVLPDGSTEWVPLGKFWVTKTTTSNNYKTVKLTCVDGMYHLSGDYNTALDYPAAIKAVVGEIVAQSGVEFIEPAVWPDVVVRVKPEKLTLRNALGYAAGCCGCNARFNREGKLEFVWYTDTGVTVELEQQYMDGLTKLHDKPLAVSFEVTGEKEKYECVVTYGENGRATATPSKGILEGDTVTVSVRPDNKYMLASISAVDAFGAPVALTEDAEGAGYTFIQPDSDVAVTVAFKPDNEGPFKLTVRSSGNGTINYAISDLGHEEGGNYFDADEEVLLFLYPSGGYAVSGFSTIPSGISVTQVGADAEGNPTYSFIMPDSDVSVTAHFREETTYTIERIVNSEGFSATPGYILLTNETTGGRSYHKGDIVSVNFARSAGYEFDHYESNVELTQIDESEFRFTMPAHNVSITAYFKEESDPNKVGKYSFLEHPSKALPPTSKPYWAVFYKHDKTVGPNARYYLVWFDSWSVSSGTIKMNGYYYCRGANNGRGYHHWDDSVWSGNGAANSTLSWAFCIGRNNEDYGLIASNLNLHANSTLIFQKCDTAIGTTQHDWCYAVGDVRDTDALSAYACPDTYSTPLPAANWMVLSGAQVYKPTEDGDYDQLVNLSGSYVVALYFDSVSVENVGQYFSNVECDYFKLTFPGGVTTVVLYESGGFGGSFTTEESCYIIVPDPYYRSQYNTAALREYTCGLMGANTDILGGGLGFYRNSTIICDCEPAASTFMFRAVRTIAPDPVTLTYTNPMIYEKMVPAIQGVVQGFTYTPARVKHRGNPAFQAGDIISCPDKDGVYHTILIQQQTLNFGGGMNSEVSCPGQTSEAASFSSASPVSTQIKEEVNKSYNELGHELGANNSAALAAIYQAMSSMKASLQAVIDSMGDDVHAATEEVTGIINRLSLAEKDIADLAGREISIEEDISYLENDVANVQAAISVLERDMGEAQVDIDAINTELDALNADVGALEARVAALEDDSDLGNLKRELAATDQQIAYCAEIFMLEVMVNGKEISAVVLPYDISELHTTRETLRAQIAELEASV